MTQENKELLLKDLCARLPYEVKVRVTQVPIGLSKDETLTYNRMYSLDESDEYITIKPYLRPMSKMTEEERERLSSLCSVHYTTSSGWDKFYLSLDIGEQVGTNLQRVVFYNNVVGIKIIDWLNAHHFDYRGLIEKGLALPAPKDMYNF